MKVNTKVAASIRSHFASGAVHIHAKATVAGVPQPEIAHFIAADGCEWI